MVARRIFGRGKRGSIPPVAVSKLGQFRSPHLVELMISISKLAILPVNCAPLFREYLIKHQAVVRADESQVNRYVTSRMTNTILSLKNIAH